MSTVVLNPTIVSTATGPLPSVIGESTGPQNATTTSTAIASFTQFQYGASIPQVVFTGVVAGDYFFLNGLLHGDSTTFSGFNWPQNFTATGANPPSVTIASTTGTTIVASSSPTTAGFASSGFLVVSQAGTTYVFSYTTISGNTFNLSNSGNSLSLGLSWNGTAVSASTMSAGSTVSQYYVPIALNATPSGTTLPTATNPVASGFTSSGYVMVIHTPLNSAASNYYVYQYTGTSAGGFTGVTLPAGLSPGGTTVPIASLSSADVVVQFFNPAGAYVTAIAALIRCGIYPSSGGIYLTVTVSSSTGLFPTQTTNIAPVQTMAGDPGSTVSVLSTAVTLTTPFAATAANLASVQVQVQVRVPPPVGGGRAEIRLPSVQLYLSTVSSPPTATLTSPNIVGVSGGVATLNSLTPTLSWAYADAEGQTQASYRVVIFPTATTQLSSFDINEPSNNGPFAVDTQWWSNTDIGIPTLPTLDTGNITSSATSVVLSGLIADNSYEQGAYGDNNTASGFQGLLAGVSYRVFVFVTAVGTSGLYPTLVNSGTVTGQVGAANAGIDFVMLAEPTLRPSLNFPSTPGNPSSSFNALTGEVGPIAVRTRQNLLDQVDSDAIGNFAAPGGSVSLSTGGWTYDSNLVSIGTGTTPVVSTIAPVVNDNDFTPGILTVSPWGTTTTQVGIKSSLVACSAGEMLTATVKVNDRQAFGAHPTTAVTFLRFYASDGVSVLATVIPPTYATVTNTAQPWMPGLVWVQAKAPIGTAFVQQGIIFKAALTTGGTTPNWYVFQPCVTNNCINIIDDAAIDSGAMHAQALSATTYLSQSANSGFTFESTVSTGCTGRVYAVGTTNPATLHNTSVLVTALPSNASDNFVVQISGQTGGNGSGTTNAALHTYYTIGSFASDVSPWLMAIDGYCPLDGNGLFQLGAISADGNATFQTGSAISISATPTRFTGTLTPGGTTVGSFGLQAIPASFGNGVYNVGSFQLERVWTLFDGNFDTFTAVTQFPPSTAIGCYPGGTTQGGQWWQVLSIDSSNALAAVTTGGQSGNCATLRTGLSGAGTPTAIEQYFTVSGLTSITPSWYWNYTSLPVGAIAQGYVEFFDSAGTPLSVAAIPGTVTTKAGLITVVSTGGSIGWTQFLPGVVPVPTTAAYAHIVFSIAPANGLSQVATLLVDTVAITLTGTLAPSTPWLDGGWSEGGLVAGVQTLVQRSPDNATWTDLRVAPGTAGLQTPSAPGFELDYTDYEFPLSSPLYYRAQVSSGITSSLYNTASITNASNFLTTEWLLIDPLYGGNITLQVKGDVSFTTDENQTVLMPAGRGRKVVLGDSAIFGDTITLNLQTLTNADFTALQAMYSKVYPLVLRSPDGEWWYVRATKRTRKRTWQGSYARPLRTYEIDFETVDAIP